MDVHSRSAFHPLLGRLRSGAPRLWPLSPELHTSDCSFACPGSSTWVDKVPSRDTPTLNLADRRGGVDPVNSQVAPARSSKRPAHVLHRYRCRCTWVSSKPSRTTPPLRQAGQRTPSGQRCWRTRAKHLASSISAERLTRSGAAMVPRAPRAGRFAIPPSTHLHRPPPGTLPRPGSITPDPDKSH